MSLSTVVADDEVQLPVRPPRTWPRRVAWVLVLALAGGLLGMAVGSRLSTRYTAEVDLLVTPMLGNAYEQTSGSNHIVDLETESHLPSSDAVLRRVAADGEGPTPSAQVMRHRLSVRVVPNAQIVVIDYAAETPAQARAMALRIADATLAERSAIAAAAATSREEVATRKLDELSAERVGSSASPARLIVMSQRQVALNVELRQARLAALAAPGQVIDTIMRGDGHMKKVRLGVVLGCAFLGALVGLWVGRSPGRDS